MPPRQTLFTDERLGARLWPSLLALPRGSGVVLRHDRLPPADRAALAHRVARLARARGLVLSVAGDVALARAVGAALVHRPSGPTRGMRFSLPVHDPGEALAARRAGAALAYVSPVHATASHPGAATLGAARARRLARLCGCPAIALGGMDARAWRALAADFAGWAGISALAR
ncbi:thiamine phosphate synthase [Sphingomicrobium astaxanthinifaciens]|uniref:thiamine phosphate synthase n=1 Tax=Sphingomicrobium astaxanthinifaciens TaxID=1227949 RepID=UPI001FCC3B6B|nr:thiamine phosphate synthase [Sphingomicrobium astaxanthinifaciens]MCJ7421187.1 thiamine phosphate synthase [Sphingomicrobium astaxanthinifaciens]